MDSRLYIDQTNIGSGHFADVRLGKRKGKTVAVKIMHDKDLSALKREVKYMMSHHSDYLMQAISWHPIPPCIVMKHMERGSLEDVVSLGCTWSWDAALTVIDQVAHGIHDMHQNGWVHFDIKPKNIFVALDYETRLGDFGCVAKVKQGDSLYYRGGTGLYMAVERFQNGLIDMQKTDMYSFGLTIFYLYIGPFEFDNEFQAQISYATKLILDKQLSLLAEQIQKYINDVNYHQGVPNGLGQLILSLTHDNPAKRPTSNELIETLHQMQLNFFLQRQREMQSYFNHLLTNIDFIIQDVLTFRGIFSIVSTELKQQAVDFLQKSFADKVKKAPLESIAQLILPFADTATMVKTLTALSQGKITFSFALGDIAQSRHSFFYRSFCVRQIANTTAIKRKPATLIEEYISGPSLQWF